jgi:glycerol-1-phosphate dehydrogenase [NAD(P)+]
MLELSDRISAEDEEAAGAVMEALCLTGLAMKLAGCSRPASGAEHVVSHYLECTKVIRGVWPDYHGRKVSAAGHILAHAYRKIAETVESIDPVPDKTDWEDVYAHYEPKLIDGVKSCNQPTITDKVDPALLKEKWPEIRKILLETLPTEEQLAAMKNTGAPTTGAEVDVDKDFMTDALRYHPYMRFRLILSRLLPMLGMDIMDFVDEF